MKASPIHDYARQLRRDQTAEARLWYRLRERRLEGFRFRRQFPIGNFIVDFCCREVANGWWLKSMAASIWNGKQRIAVAAN